VGRVVIDLLQLAFVYAVWALALEEIEGRPE